MAALLADVAASITRPGLEPIHVGSESVLWPCPDCAGVWSETAPPRSATVRRTAGRCPAHWISRFDTSPREPVAVPAFRLADPGGARLLGEPADPGNRLRRVPAVRQVSVVDDWGRVLLHTPGQLVAAAPGRGPTDRLRPVSRPLPTAAGRAHLAARTVACLVRFIPVSLRACGSGVPAPPRPTSRRAAREALPAALHSRPGPTAGFRPSADRQSSVTTAATTAADAVKQTLCLRSVQPPTGTAAGHIRGCCDFISANAEV